MYIIGISPDLKMEELVEKGVYIVFYVCDIDYTKAALSIYGCNTKLSGSLHWKSSNVLGS